MEQFVKKFDSLLAFNLCKELNLGNFEDFYFIPAQKVDLKETPVDLLAIVVSGGKNSSTKNNITVLFDDFGVVNTITNEKPFLPVHSEYAHVLEMPGTKTVSQKHMTFMANHFGPAYIARATASRRRELDLNSEVVSFWFNLSKKTFHMQEKIEQKIKKIPYQSPVPESLRDEYAFILMQADKNKRAIQTFQKKHDYLKSMLDFALSLAHEHASAQHANATQSES